MVRSLSAALIALGLVVGANAKIAPALQSARISTDEEEELGLFPSGLLVGPASCGFRNVVADLLWLRAIQYYGKHKQGDQLFEKAAHVFSVLTDLDPNFIGAYRFGSLVLVEDAGEKEKGFALLRKGVRKNPLDGSLYFDLGFHHFMAEDYGRAAVYFRRAASLPGGSDKAARFAAYAENRQGRFDVAEEMWLDILSNTGNDKTRASAEFALKGIAAARDTLFLAERARTFHDRYGRFPRSVNEMIDSGVIRSAPEDPFGTYYVVQPATGEVRSWYLLARELKRDCAVLDKVAARYAEERGSPPADAAALVEEGYLGKIPSPFGVTYTFDRRTGKAGVLFPSGREMGGDR